MEPSRARGAPGLGRELEPHADWAALRPSCVGWEGTGEMRWLLRRAEAAELGRAGAGVNVPRQQLWLGSLVHSLSLFFSGKQPSGAPSAGREAESCEVALCLPRRAILSPGCDTERGLAEISWRAISQQFPTSFAENNTFRKRMRLLGCPLGAGLFLFRRSVIRVSTKQK